MRFVAMSVLLCACGSVEENRDDAMVATDGMTSTIDAPADVDAALDAPLGEPRNCREVLMRNPSSVSGMYTVDPDGEGAGGTIQVQCDMTSNGGGWTIIFVAQMTDYLACPIPYTEANPQLRATATEALIAYRTSSGTAIADANAMPTSFAIPVDWKNDSPMSGAYRQVDVSVMASVGGASPTPATLKYGCDNFGYGVTPPITCASVWGMPSGTTNGGRICVANVASPMWHTFAADDGARVDQCGGSLRDYLAGPDCGAERRFTIAVR